MKKNNKKIVYSELFLTLSILFVTCLLMSNILAAKLLKIGNYSITAGVLVFPISYIINDIFSEIYGYKKTKKIVLIGFAMNIFMVLIFSLAIFLPAPIWFESSDSFALILGTTPRTCIASLMAYLFGSLVNSKVLVKLKRKNEKQFGLRAIISTICGETVDSLLFVSIAFIGSMTSEQLITMILIQVILKTVYEIICLPITKLAVGKIKEHEKQYGV